jgi:hypothetical protein
MPLLVVYEPDYPYGLQSPKWVSMIQNAPSNREGLLEHESLDALIGYFVAKSVMDA